MVNEKMYLLQYDCRIKKKKQFMSFSVKNQKIAMTQTASKYNKGCTKCRKENLDKTSIHIVL